jgi:hypothetical protein
MNQKALNLALIATSLVAYLEWGGNNSMFLFQGEWDILQKLFTDPLSVAHPFTVLPMLGQVLLLTTLFQKQPSKILTWIGILGMGILLLFIFIIGLMGLNMKITMSVVPFLIIAIISILNLRKPVSTT